MICEQSLSTANITSSIITKMTRERHGVWNLRQLDYSFNNPSVIGDFPSQRAGNAKSVVMAWLNINSQA